MHKKLDDARLALIMSVADLYFDPDLKEDEALMREIIKEFPKEEANLMELMPAWSRKGYEEGMQKGIEQGIEKGIEKGIEQGIEQGIEIGIKQGIEQGIQLIKQEMIPKLLSKGFTPEEVADIVDLPLGRYSVMRSKK